MKPIIIALLLTVSAFGQDRYKWNVFSNNLDIVGGYTAPSGYATSLQSAATTLTITAATHGQGTSPTVTCYQSSDGEQVLPQVLNAGLLGDIVLNWSPAFTGYCFLRGPGSGAGAAGNVIGPSSAVSGNLPQFSGTSGKILADSGILATNVVQGPASATSANLASYNGTTGKLLADSAIAVSTVVKGAAALTTAGAVPIVTSAGTLTQDQTAGGQFFWDATLHNLGVGTVLPLSRIDARAVASASLPTIAIRPVSGADYSSFGIYPRISGAGANTRAWAMWANYNGDGDLVFAQSTNSTSDPNGATGMMLTRARNLLVGAGITEGNFKIDATSSGSSGTLRAYDQTATTGSTLAVVRAGAGQSSNPLIELRDSSNTLLSYFRSNGDYGGTGISIFAVGSINDFNSRKYTLTGGAIPSIATASNFVFGWTTGTGAGTDGGNPANFDTGLARNAAGVLEVNSGTAGTYRDAKVRTLIGGGTAPSPSSGSMVTGSTNIAGAINSATTGAFSTVLTFSGTTAPNGWSCTAFNSTTVANTIGQTASSTTTATIAGTTVSGDVIRYVCAAY